MAEQHGAHQTAEAWVISLTEDFCKSPTAPVGYMIAQKLSESIQPASSVHGCGTPLLNLGSRISTVIGNEAGVGGGVVSGVNVGMCKPVAEFAPKVRAEGQCVLRHDTVLEMNCAGPAGTGNTRGKVFYFSPAPAGGASGTAPSDGANSTEPSGSESSSNPPNNSSQAASGTPSGSPPPEVLVEGDWHKRLVVLKDGKTYVFEGGPDSANVFNANLIVQERHVRPGALASTSLSPPAGQTAAEFADSVIAAGRNAVFNSGTLSYGLLGGDGVVGGSANSNSIVREILRDAGFTDPIPTFCAPGLNLGVHYRSAPATPAPWVPYMDPETVPPEMLKKPGQLNSPPVGGFLVDPWTGKVTYG